MVPILNEQQVEALEISEASEYTRMAFWPTIMPQLRAFLVHLAGLPRDRAQAPLEALTMDERFKLAAHATVLESNLRVARFCLLDPTVPTVLRLH